MFAVSITFFLSAVMFAVKGANQPKINPFHFSGELKLGKRVSVLCSVIDGEPPFEFQWFKDGSKMGDKAGVDIQVIDVYTSKFTVTRLGAESNGNYTCQVTNSGGVHQQSDILRIKGTRHFSLTKNYY